MIELDRFPLRMTQADPELRALPWQRKLTVNDLELERVLVVRPAGMGDVVLMTPALRALRELRPDAHITLLTSPSGSRTAPLLPWIDDVIVSQALRQDTGLKRAFDPQRELGLIQEIRESGFDTAFIFAGSMQSALPAAYACYLAGIPNRVGFSNEIPGRVLTVIPPTPADELHEAERSLALLEALEIPVNKRGLELDIPAGVQESADQILRSMDIRPERPFILLAPGAGEAARRYDPQHYAAVLRFLSAEAGIPVLVTGSAQEMAALRPVTDAVEELHGSQVHSLVGRTSVPQLAAMIRRSSLVITNNCGVLPIADAFRRPVVALFSGSGLVSQWKPRNSRARLLTQPVHCAPCYQSECPFNMRCLDIRPDEVAIAALELLAERVYFRPASLRRSRDVINHAL